jgi:hypothetical protein
MIVDVIQYMRPNGRQVPLKLEIDDKCEAKYKEIINCGCRLACEQLQTLEASQTIENADLGFDFDIIITEGSDFNENEKALEDMILRFDIKSYEIMKKEFE